MNMNTISKTIASDSPGNTKKAFLSALSLNGASLQIGINFSYADANGMQLQPAGNSKKGITIAATGLDAPANLSDADKDKIAAQNVIYNNLIAAITPFIEQLIDANTEPAA